MTRQEVLNRVRAELEQIQTAEEIEAEAKRVCEEVQRIALRGRLHTILSDPHSRDEQLMQAQAALHFLETSFDASV